MLKKSLVTGYRGFKCQPADFKAGQAVVKMTPQRMFGSLGMNDEKTEHIELTPEELERKQGILK